MGIRVRVRGFSLPFRLQLGLLTIYPFIACAWLSGVWPSAMSANVSAVGSGCG